MLKCFYAFISFLLILPAYENMLSIYLSIYHLFQMQDAGLLLAFMVGRDWIELVDQVGEVLPFENY